MQFIIPRAIRERRLLRLVYDGRARTVEPHLFGLIEGKHDAVLCRQVSPPVVGGERWHVFHLSKIVDLRMLEDKFESPADQQAPADQFTEIYVSLWQDSEATLPATPPGNAAGSTSPQAASSH